MNEFRTIDRGDIKWFVEQTKLGMFHDVTISDFLSAYRKIFRRQHNDIITDTLPNNDNLTTVI